MSVEFITVIYFDIYIKMLQYVWLQFILIKIKENIWKNFIKISSQEKIALNVGMNITTIFKMGGKTIKTPEEIHTQNTSQFV